ncbi:GATOR2 complex protein MIOS isoform X1 [Ochlerotatus camptorhynchus]|uniref:GATOR2 complex protein MIOS isoform X1 n=1 Tax=Ochlerotatus camptorhynchus TaxID=644619 RepID=UPI0031DF6E35
MTQTVVELHWFPKYPDRFLTAAGSEINLYQVKHRDLIDHGINTSELHINLNISKNTTATLIAFETRYQFIRSVAPSYHSTGEILFATGLPNGKVALCNFASENNVEFTPRLSRPCTCLAWSELEPSLLAMGHDRNRSDHCITIWDTERGVPNQSSILQLIGLSETAHSICWDKTFPQVMIAGMSHKHIKMMDFRQNPAIVTVANARTVNGLCIAPNGRYLSSYVDNVINLWDLRSLDKPISQIQMQKNITHLSWCPTRSSVLTTLQRDSPLINLIDLHWPGSEMDGGDPHSIKRFVSPFQARTGNRMPTMGYLSWHPFDLERMLALSGTGTICDYRIPQRVAISWDNNNNLYGNNGNELQQFTSPSPPTSPTDSLNQWDCGIDSYEEDIAETIQKRALNNYGLTAEMHRNGDLAGNANLRGVWRLLSHMIKEDCKLGLNTILGVCSAPDGPAMSRSDPVMMKWLDFSIGSGLVVYRSEHRDTAQLLCGWTFDRSKESSFLAFIDELCSNKEYTRAALIACFHFRIKQAIDILGRGAEQSSDPSSLLRVAAIALSGFSAERSGLWRKQCGAARTQIDDPYLRCMFSFLAHEKDGFETVTNETEISLCDRMAFACNFLSDLKLAEYIKGMVANCIESGDLNGLLLTGATNDGIKLLQSHLDRTEDVQTVALIAARFLTSDLLTDYRVQYWISTYRDLLDIWGLWEQRAQLDITLGRIRSPPQNSRSVFLLCNFCGKNVSMALQEDARLRSNAAVMHKLSSCPNCRKPLPRCALCLLHMGTTMGAISQGHAAQGQIGWQSKPFSKWFSWCQTCRHGGHTEHLAEWFNENTECPVTSCSCKCFAKDLPMPQFPREKDTLS